MSIDAFILKIEESVNALKDRLSSLTAIEREIPQWQEETRRFLERRRKSVYAALASELTRANTAIHVRDASIGVLEVELAAAKHTYGMTPITQFTKGELERRKKEIDEMEWLIELKKEGGQRTDD